MATIEPKSESAADEPTTGRTVLPGAPPFTVDDLLEFPDDGNRYELFNGSLLVSPSPAPPHQRALYRLQRILDDASPPELEPLSTVNVRLTDKDFVIPDLVVVPEEASETVGLMFSPADLLLAVEVGSPSTIMVDEGTKAILYAKAGVPSYWRIELANEPTLYVHELNGDTYDPPVAYKAGDVAHLTTPFAVGFDPAELVRGRR
ncbi:Uma2 family endonuclease [Nonomuraea mesophila]|uniref:Uma2 family endonuclease n=1 Tax=Nonomuraea mesophila TaxID=2530382 RepID=A0A4R5FFI6_9ACTN|nr:Uma2 family endonuclease [Nonomuraea mesophila]TDE49744.1 Uma2 family endonuclease [Nonomuraea mesophila]